MSDREPVEWLEIDVDICPLTFGVGPCTASLGGVVTDKCFNTVETCAAREALNAAGLTTQTLRFIQPRANLPKGSTWFPCLDSVTGSSSTVNIAGANPDLAPLGKRATVTAKGWDFPYHDRLTDKYQTQRVSGVAQLDGVGYLPEDFGTFMTRHRARHPFYAGRSMRRCSGYLDGGVLTTAAVRHFIMTEMAIDGREWTIEGKDILDLADDKRVQAPKAVNGSLAADMTNVAMALTLTPPGIGNLQYPASGFATIGSELVQFTRSADAVTITARGVSGTTISAHSLGDSFQTSFSPRKMRLVPLLQALLVDHAGINPSFIDLTAWNAEVNRWAPTLRLTADITKPEGVAKLIGELAILGVSIWWDEVAQKIGLKMNRPIDLDDVKTISDRNTLIDIEIEDRDEDRITTVQFFTVMLDPTKSATDPNSYARQRYIVDAGAVSEQEFGDSRVRQIFCRWLNHGDDAAAAVLGRRFLQTFVRSPKRIKMLVDFRDDMGLTEVAELDTREIRSPTGRPMIQYLQIAGREEKVAGHRVQLTGQAYSFGNKRYGYITENDRPDYAASSEAQKARGFYISDNGGKMSDGSDGYRLI